MTPADVQIQARKPEVIIFFDDKHEHPSAPVADSRFLGMNDFTHLSCYEICHISLTNFTHSRKNILLRHVVRVLSIYTIGLSLKCSCIKYCKRVIHIGCLFRQNVLSSGVWAELLSM
jgi:hypothetical protein